MTHLSKPTLGAEVSGWDTGNSGWGAETSEQDAGNSGWGSETAGQEKKKKKKKERSGWVAQEEPEERGAVSSSAGHDLPRKHSFIVPLSLAFFFALVDSHKDTKTDVHPYSAPATTSDANLEFVWPDGV